MNHSTAKKILLTFILLFSIGYIILALRDTDVFIKTDIAQFQNTASVPKKIKKLETENLTYAFNNSATSLIHVKKEGGVIPLEIKNFTNAEHSANQFLKEYGTYFGIKKPQQDLKLRIKKEDPRGKHHLRYEQHYKGIPVFGGEMIVHVNSDFSVQSANGKMLEKISSIQKKPKISAQKAQSEVKKYWEQRFQSTPALSEPKLYILNKNFINPKEEKKNYLAWEIEAINPVIGKRKFFFIDAKSGKIIYQLEGTKTLYRVVYDCDDTDDNCVIERKEDERRVNNADIDDTYEYLGDAHRYFQEKLNINGANDVGGLSATHISFVGTEIDIGFTKSYNRYIMRNDDGDDICPNAVWFGSGVAFCTGVATRNVVGHEYTHAVTDFNGPELVYEGESGAIDEAFSDIFGAAIDNYVSPTNNWNNQWRDIAAPSNTNNPDTYFSPLFSCTEDDNHGVHQNSTVLSHAAYVLTTTGGNFNGCTINVISRHEAELILLNTLVYFLPENASFNEFYIAVVDACDDLYNLVPGNSYIHPTCREVRKVFQAALIDQRNGGTCSGVAPKVPTCLTPTIANVSSENRDNTYSENDTITIDVYFSKPVTSENVTVTLNVNDAEERSCSFAIRNTDKGSCTYTVMTRDYSTDLNVKNISGTIVDSNKTTMLNFTPQRNLAENRNIVIDARIAEIDTHASPFNELEPNIPLPEENNQPIYQLDIPREITQPPINIPLPLPSPSPQPEVLSRIPDITAAVIKDEQTYTINGKINSFGTMSSCTEPNSRNPIIIYWDDGTTERPVIRPDLTFSSSHMYGEKKHKSYEIHIKTTNSCYGSSSTKIPIDF